MDLIILLLVFLVGILAAFIGVIAGGGGLITVPILIFLGLDPKMAIATAKLGGLGGVTIGSYRYYRSKKINFKVGIYILIIFTLGSLIGPFVLIQMSQEIVQKMVGIILLIMLPIIIFSGKGIKRNKNIKKREKIIGYLLLFAIGFYSTFFGGGWAILAIYALIMFFGFSFIESTATSIFGSLISYPLSIIIYTMYGMVNYVLGIPLMLGMMVGGYIGARTAVKKGNKFVRLLFIIVVVASAVKLLFF